MSKFILGKSVKAVGKHYTTKVTATPIEHNLDDREAAIVPAKAIAKMIGERIKGITQRAADSTIAKRKRKALGDGPVSARRLRAQTVSTTVFKDSGYLADGIHMTEDRPGSFQTKAPPGRLGPEAPWIIRQLMEVIDVTPQTIMQVPEVKRAIEESVRRMIKKGK